MGRSFEVYGQSSVSRVMTEAVCAARNWVRMVEYSFYELLRSRRCDFDVTLATQLQRSRPQQPLQRRRTGRGRQKREQKKGGGAGGGGGGGGGGAGLHYAPAFSENGREAN